MAKQYCAFFVSWRHAKRRPFGWFADEASYRRAAAEALEAKINALAEEGWIIDQIMPASGLTAKDCAGFTIIAFK
ncbi:MAG: hypothetical protein AAFY22_00040 [Pseudomonadota bacterium]